VVYATEPADKRISWGSDMLSARAKRRSDSYAEKSKG
jgi:hypothetical protein